MTRWLLAAALALSALPACRGKASDQPVGISASQGEPVKFAYDSLDERAVSSEAARGKPAVLAFIATYDMLSQAQADFLSVMAKTDGDKISYYLIALDERSNRELVEAFATTLALSCPVAMGDPDTVAGRTVFGTVAVPTVIVLDAAGRVAWRKEGLAKSDELREVLASVERASTLRARPD